MTFLDVQNQVVNMSLVQSQTALVQFSIQWAINRISQYFEWPYYMQNQVITTTAPYSTGTVAVTNGSATVTGTNTVWTSAMVGRKIQIGGDNAYYYVLTVNSTTSITLAVPYQGTTQSGSTYNIYKDEYKLSPDVQAYKTIVQIQNSLAMNGMPPTKFDKIFPTQTSFSSPYIEVMEGTKLDTYVTGTVSTTINSGTITGVGTSWSSVEGLGRMTDIIIASNRYTVKSVNSDTSITTYENALGTVSASSYTLNLRNIKVQVFPIPNDQENLYYRYFRMPDILVNSYDVPDLPQDWHWIIVWGALSWIYLQKGDIEKAYTQAEARFLEGLQNMKKKIGNHAADRIYRRNSQDRGNVFFDGLEKGSFDRRYSSP
jgi:hypothetical protein